MAEAPSASGERGWRMTNGRHLGQTERKREEEDGDDGDMATAQIENRMHSQKGGEGGGA